MCPPEGIAPQSKQADLRNESKFPMPNLERSIVRKMKIEPTDIPANIHRFSGRENHEQDQASIP
jgi:hypothetical protein